MAFDYKTCSTICMPNKIGEIVNLKLQIYNVADDQFYL